MSVQVISRVWIWNIPSFNIGLEFRKLFGMSLQRDHLQISLLILSKLKQINFYSALNQHKTYDFLMILLGIKVEYFT